MKKQTVKKSNIGEILQDAFNYWKLSFNVQIFFSLLYFSIIFLLVFHFFKYYGLMPEFLRLMELSKTDIPATEEGILKWTKDPNFASFIIASVIIKAVMFPLNIGLFHVYRKIDKKLAFNISDLYEGYRGFNFFKFLGFAIFWGFIHLYANAIFRPLAWVWVFITIFSAPLMFFMNITILESIRVTIKALKTDFFTIIICSILACIFSYFGLFFFFIGILITFPFWNAVIYSMYQKYFNEIEKEALV